MTSKMTIINGWRYWLYDAFQKLNERERLILNLRFYHGKTQMEVADDRHFPGSRISRPEKSALGHLRKFVQ